MKKRFHFNFDHHIADALLEGLILLSVDIGVQCQGLSDYCVLDMNKQAEVITGLNREEAVGLAIDGVLQFSENCWPRFRKQLLESGNSKVEEYFIESLDRNFLVHCLRLCEKNVLVFFSETTCQHRMEEILPIHQILFENAHDIILYINLKGQVVNANQMACNSYGYSKEQLLNMRIQDIRHSSTAVDYEYQMEQAELAGVVFESTHIRADGSAFPVEVSARTAATGYGRLRIHIIRDISERKQREQEIAWLARHDGLTKVLNRSSFLTELEKEIERSNRNQSRFAVFLLDIDRFKQINDTFGHEAGDLVLKEVAKRIQSVLRTSDHLGRLGGDEFTVMQTNLQSKDGLVAMVERIIQVTKKPIQYNDVNLTVQLSLGIACFPADSRSSNELMHFADQAMYQTKKLGRGGYSFYNEILESEKRVTKL